MGAGLIWAKVAAPRPRIRDSIPYVRRGIRVHEVWTLDAKEEIQAVQVAIQQALKKWSCPQCLRLDNGLPWRTTSDVPSALALWLSGLGIRVVFGRPRQRTDNAVIECCHRELDD